MKSARRRIGDRIQIGGAYQHDALTSGHPVQRFWHRSKQLVIAEFLPPTAGEFVVDVGCGSGVIAAFLAGYGAEVVGVDANPSAVKFAETQYGSSGVRFVHGLVDERMDFERTADKIYCLEVIEHVYEQQAKVMLKAFSSMLRPGGSVLLSTPNYRSLWPLIEWGLDLFMNTAYMDKDQHVCHYTSKRLRTLAADTGFIQVCAGSFCGIAPWLALLSESFAERIHHLETHSPFLWGSLLYQVLRKE